MGAGQNLSAVDRTRSILEDLEDVQDHWGHPHSPPAAGEPNPWPEKGGSCFDTCVATIVLLSQRITKANTQMKLTSFCHFSGTVSFSPLSLSPVFPPLARPS